MFLTSRRIAAAVMVMLLHACAFSAIALHGKFFSQAERIEVDYVNVSFGSISRFEHATGRIVTLDSRKLAFTQSGVLKKLWVKEGDVIRAGDLLAELAPDADQAEKLALARIDEIASNRRIRLAQETLLQEQELKSAGIISVSALQKTEQGVADEQEKQQRAALSLRVLQKKSAMTRLYADVDAQVVAVDMVQGQNVGSAQSITLVNRARLAIEARVDETIAAQLKPGQEVQYSFAAASDKNVKGTSAVNFIFPSFESSGGSNNSFINNGIKVQININPVDLPLLRINQQVQLDLLIQSKAQATLVPSQAIVIDHGLQYILIMSGKEIHWLQVETGIEQADLTEVISPPLAVGMSIVVPKPGATPPRNGQLVKVRAQ